MSEQPTSSVVDLDRYREGTRFGMQPGEDRIDLHAYNTVPKYDTRAVELGRQMFMKTGIEQPKLSEVAVRGVKLAKLNEIRDSFKLIEETEFLKEAA